MLPIACSRCQQVFSPKIPRQYACRPCHDAIERARARERMRARAATAPKRAPLPEKHCAICQAAFTPKSSSQVCCENEACRYERRMRNERGYGPTDPTWKKRSLHEHYMASAAQTAVGRTLPR